MELAKTIPHRTTTNIVLSTSLLSPNKTVIQMNLIFRNLDKSCSNDGSKLNILETGDQILEETSRKFRHNLDYFYILIY